MPKNEIVSASKGTTGYGHRDNCRGKRPNWKPARSKERRAVRGATYCCSEPRRATEGLLRESPEWRSSSQRDASSRRFAPRFARRAIETIRGPRIPFDAANRTSERIRSRQRIGERHFGGQLRPNGHPAPYERQKQRSFRDDSRTSPDGRSHRGLGRSAFRGTGAFAIRPRGTLEMSQEFAMIPTGW